LAEKWNELLFTSNKLIQLKTSGVSGMNILRLNQDFDLSYNNMNAEIDTAIESTTANIEQRQIFIESLINEITWGVVIALNLFILTTLLIRFLILKSISKPLDKMRQITTAIAKGDYVLYPETGNDEISELGKDINIMSKDLAELHKKIIEKERLSSIGALSTRLAHDIRNPLSVIKNSFEIIKIKSKNNLDDSVISNFDRIARAVDRITHQTKNVLDFVNVSELQYTQQSLVSIIHSTIKNTDITENVDIVLPKNDFTIYCDSYKLEIVFTNLIHNAIYAINGNGKILFRLLDNEEEVIIEIEDSGIGIPDSMLEKIFDPLFTTKQTGTGLGLSSCQSIVEAHGGKISVQNDPTIFTIRLLKKPPDNQVPIKKEFAKSMMADDVTVH